MPKNDIIRNIREQISQENLRGMEVIQKVNLTTFITLS